jgi:DNA-binding NarL/FixJ family response regulator
MGDYIPGVILPSVPPILTPELWQHVIATFKLPPQQARIVSLILQDYGDKQICMYMKLSRNTVRTYLRRTFDNVGVNSRMGLIMSILDVCMQAEEGLQDAVAASDPNRTPVEAIATPGQIAAMEDVCQAVQT